MKKEISEYIRKEKELSSFKISVLKNRISKDISSDVLEGELSFFKYNFEEINFESIDECRKALTLFRRSKDLFDQKYKNKKYNINFEEIYKYLFEEIDSIKVDENLIGGFFVPNISNRNMYNKDKSIRSFVFKITMKQKVILNCLIKCFKNLEDYSEEYTFEELDYFFSTLKHNLYRYYNKSFEILKEAGCFNSTELKKFKNLENAICLYEKLEVANKDKFFAMLSMPHKGYEKISPLYLSIKNENGSVINISYKFKVILKKDVYYKAVELNSANIDLDKSEIIIASTRREMEDFLNLKSWLKDKIETLKNNYIFRRKNDSEIV